MKMSIAVRNANHDRVLSVLKAIHRADGGAQCFCSECTNAIAATALNCLSPHYYVEQEREQQAGSPWIMVEQAVLEAIEQLHEQPDRLCLRAQLKRYRRMTR